MTWSASRLKTYESCAAKYSYRYVEKRPQGESSPQAARGSNIHAAIEAAVKSGGDIPEEAGHLVSTYLRGLRFSKAVALSEFDLKLDRQWKQVIAGDYWYHGILDLLVLDDTKANVDDWKTGKMYKEHDDDKELYAIAVMSAYEHVEEVLTQYHYIDQGKMVPKVFYRHHVEPAKERWTRRVLKMENESDFIPSPGYLCRYCPYSKAKGGPCRF